MIVTRDIEKKDLGLPYWRLRISINDRYSYIHIRIENFEYGFIDGESWDKVFIHNQTHYKSHDYTVSIITKRSYEYLMDRYDEIIEIFYNNIFNIKKKISEEYKKAVKMYNKEMNIIESIQSSELFTQINRENQLNKII